jgi:hypothetical protein
MFVASARFAAIGAMFSRNVLSQEIRFLAERLGSFGSYWVLYWIKPVITVALTRT